MSHTIETLVLRNACVLLASSLRWTSGAWARDEKGMRCQPISPRARRWCAWGALQKCAYELIGEERAARMTANRISKRLVPGPGGLVFVNERGGYELVWAVMRSGGPPADAEATWPFADFRTRQGFAAFARGSAAVAIDEEMDWPDRLQRKPVSRVPPSKSVGCNHAKLLCLQ
jgi:hypothetical protein